MSKLWIGGHAPPSQTQWSGAGSPSTTTMVINTTNDKIQRDKAMSLRITVCSCRIFCAEWFLTRWQLSSGQRARVSLARDVYARADLWVILPWTLTYRNPSYAHRVLMDDVLAAVDSHVARHVFGMCHVPRLILILYGSSRSCHWSSWPACDQSKSFSD